APPPPAKGQIGRLPKDRYTSELTFGQAGEGDGQLLEPRGVAVDDAGNVYVADTGNARVQKFDKDGNFLAKWGRKGEGEADFLEPVAVVIDPDGNLVVLDAEQGWLKRFTTDGKFLGRFGGPPAAFYHPRGLDVDAEGNFYVADTGTSSVARFNKRGELVGRSGEKGTGAGQLVEPTDVLIAPAGGFYVADSANSKLVWYDSAWKVQAEWPLPKSGSAFGPHLAMAGDQSLFVSDADGHRIIRLSRTGEPLAEIGGEDLLKRPLQVAVDGQGNLYVADSADHRIVKLVQGE
ncbi:MAG: NHL repeat-containing protein, partial [Chloroflexi bacterium]|nr:NHL repeat-containing protein [Chloroflexota bacterium]